MINRSVLNTKDELYLFPLKSNVPPIIASRNKPKKIKNKILAMLAAPAAIPVNPKSAAIIATTKNIAGQRNMI